MYHLGYDGALHGKGQTSCCNAKRLDQSKSMGVVKAYSMSVVKAHSMRMIHNYSSFFSFLMIWSPWTLKL